MSSRKRLRFFDALARLLRLAIAVSSVPSYLDELIQPKVEGPLADIRRRGMVVDAVAGVVKSLRARTRACSAL